MSDPLSIAASITGLIAVAGQLYITLDTFVSNVKDAPLLSRIILSEVKSFRNTLHALQQLLSNPNFYRSSRGALISADYVVVSFTDAVLLFSELEAIITPLSAYAPELGLAAKAQWVRKKQRLNELVGRLQWQKHTLVLQLNILKCASDVDAEQNRQVLNNMICERLAKDRDMERRLEQVESHLRLQSTASFRDNASIRSDSTADSDNMTIRAGHPTATISASSNSIGSSDSLPIRDFEALLNSSWVYQRNEHRDETMSFHSSVLRLSAWSVLSDMSLANISIIAVMSLPVQLQELSNGHWYARCSHTFDQVGGAAEMSGGLPPAETETVTDLDQLQIDLPHDDGDLFVRDAPSVVIQVSEADNIPSPVANMPGSKTSAQEEFSTRPAVDDHTVTRKSSWDEYYQRRKISGLDSASRNDTQPPSHTKRKKKSQALPEAVEKFRQRLIAGDATLDGKDRDDMLSAPVNPAGNLENNLEDDYDDVVYPCKGCGEILEEGKAFELVGNRWHIECFKCNTCGTLLDSDANLLLLGDGSLICNNCTYSCSACNKKIEDLAILTGDQAFCADCFRCRNCKRKIENLRYARTSLGLFCIPCHDTLLERRRANGRNAEKTIQASVPPAIDSPAPGINIGGTLGFF